MKRWKWMLWISAIVILSIYAGTGHAETTVLDFFADWCGSCQSMTPVMDKLAGEGIAIKRVNIERDRDLATMYKIESVPTFVILDNGRESGRIVGTASVQQIKEKLPKKKSNPQSLIPNPSQKPHPAWRYENPIGKYAAVVRVICQDNDRTRSLGSGVIVRWAGRLIVITARHVIRDAKAITIKTAGGKTVRVRVVKTDPTWDCAVLEPLEAVEGVESAEIEYGNAAMQNKGDRLESCGFGADDTLAVNSGLFIGYRRSSATTAGPDDWMSISGKARQGDSGGPVFNSRGRLVGILWGTNGEEVLCVQAGRIHATLAAAFPITQLAAMERRPTPPLNQAPDSNWRESVPETAANSGGYMLPYRNEQAEKESAMNRQLERIQGTLEQIEAKMNQPGKTLPSAGNVIPLPPAATDPEKPDATEDGGPRTAAGRIAQRGADWLSEHGGPLSSRLAAGAGEKLDSDSPAVRFVGWTQAKAAWAVFLGAIACIFGLIVFLLHRLNNRLLPILQAKAAATPNKVDDAVVAGLTFLHNRVGGLEDKLRNRFTGGATDTAQPKTNDTTVKADA